MKTLADLQATESFRFVGTGLDKFISLFPSAKGVVTTATIFRKGVVTNHHDVGRLVSVQKLPEGASYGIPLSDQKDMQVTTSLRS